jgi:hypothetical protein
VLAVRNLIFNIFHIGHVARIGKKKTAYTVLVGKPEGKRTPEKPRLWCEDNIKMDLREVG